MSNETMWLKILRAKERGRPETGARKPYLGSTENGRSQTQSSIYAEPVRVPVPDEFLEPQPYIRRSELSGPHITAERSRKHARRGWRADNHDSSDHIDWQRTEKR